MYLDVKERLGIVFGGDAHEGERKVKYLLECGANVKLFSPDDEISPALRTKADAGEIEWINRKYQAGDLAGAWIVIVADTSSMETNEAVSKEATERNVMDVTPLCTWIAPALIHRNDITLAVSTAGSSPALARKLREEITSDSCQCMRWANVGPIFTEVRQIVRSQNIVCCPEKWQWFMTPEWLEKAEKTDPKQAKSDLIEGITSVACASCAPFGSCQRIETPPPKH